MMQEELFPFPTISVISDMVITTNAPSVEFRSDVHLRYVKTFIEMMSCGQIRVYDSFGNELKIRAIF
jgi:hypothetical protein